LFVVAYPAENRTTSFSRKKKRKKTFKKTMNKTGTGDALV
jgi:hypothetical protein